MKRIIILAILLLSATIASAQEGKNLYNRYSYKVTQKNTNNHTNIRQISVLIVLSKQPLYCYKLPMHQ